MPFETTIAVKIDSKGAATGSRIAKGELRQLSLAANKAEGSFDRVRKSARSAGTALAKFVGAAAVATFFTKASKGALDFSTAMAEVSTLIPGTSAQMMALNEQALQMSETFASTPAEQAKALYQVISAGAGTAAKQTEVLTAANKLAVGGVTDIETAADGLTSVLNAYGAKVKGSTDVTDTMFVAMRAGKTTIGELSSSLGLVAPLAETTGVKFTELTATVAALTKGGISTRIAVSGLRGILAAVAKPTKEARDEAERLELGFSVAAIEAGGFAKFLDEVKTKTKGSTDSLAQLFGGVEALIPILRLSGTGSKDFIEIMKQMADRSGATEEAFQKIANSVPFRLGKLKSEFLSFSTKVGQSFNRSLVPSMELVRDNIGFLKNALVGLTAAFAARTVLGAAIAFIKFARALTIARAASIALTAVQNVGKAGFVVLAVVVAQITGSFDKLKVILENAKEAAKQFVGPEALGKLREVLKFLNIDTKALDREITNLNSTLEQVQFGGGAAPAPGRQSPAVKDASDSLKDFAASLKDEVRTPTETHEQQLLRINEAMTTVDQTTGQYLITQTEATRATEQANQAFLETDPLLSRVSSGIGSFTDGLIDAAVQGKSFGETMKSVFKNMVGTILKELARIAASKLLFWLLGFGGFGGGGGGGGGGFMSMTTVAKGGAFNQGNIMPFAGGGIVSKPTVFPMAGGAGLMGEAGPEAILPLRRGPSGKLGVESTGRGGVTINIDARGSNGDAAVEAAVERGIRRASPQLINASVNRVQSDRQRDPNFFK